MPHQTDVRNPFMLLICPEVVLAAIENSERLGKLNRKLCRPLDGPMPTAGNADSTEETGEEIELSITTGS